MDPCGRQRWSTRRQSGRAKAGTHRQLNHPVGSAGGRRVWRTKAGAGRETRERVSVCGRRRVRVGAGVVRVTIGAAACSRCRARKQERSVIRQQEHTQRIR